MASRVGDASAPPVKAPSPEADRRAELRDRLAITILLLPLAFFVVEAGGLVFLAGAVLLLGQAALEFARLFRVGGCRPALPLLVGGVGLLLVSEHFPALNAGGWLAPALVLGPLVWHLLDYERGAPASGTDFVVTVGGLFYLGVLGRHFVALRGLPFGLWWFIATLSSMWLADSGAYIFGRLFGRRRMSPRLSPKKTWEGYLGSVLSGGVGGGLLSVFWSLGAGPGSLLTWQTGALLGLLVGALGPVGDLGVSMFKRQVGVKDTGTLMGGHGGALDRIDSWLVAVVVGYYFVQALNFIVR